MPPRPALKARERPTSAIYLGAGHRPNSASAGSAVEIHQQSSSSPHLVNSHPGGLPDLPEPESPTSSRNSSDSGLPSPPATNSTGSGSTGDPGSVARRQRPLSFASDSSTSTSNSSQKTMSDVFRRGTTSRSVSRSSNRPESRNDHDDDDDEDNDNEDDTARLDRRHHVKSSSENVRALQRVMSLTQRNRMALDKLSRLGSPSPTPRSKSPSHASTTSSSRLRQTRIVSQPALRDPGHSGSETERESASVQTYSSHSQSSSSQASSSQRPITPPPNTALPNTTSPYSRLRNISAPSSPRNARRLLAGSGDSNLSDSPSRRASKRASMATMASITQNYEEEDERISNNYYATTAGPGRERQRNDRDTVRDITASALAAVASSRRSPVSARRRGALPREFREDLSTADSGSVVSDARTRRSEDVDSRSHRLSQEPMTPYRSNTVGRATTLRETRYNAGPSRPATLDLRSTALDVSPSDGYRRERRQTLRGGSAESALSGRSPGGRTLLGEGLRAAGLTKREESRPLSTARLGDGFHDKQEDWSPTDGHNKGKRRALTYGRSATSMSNYRQTDSPEDERPIRDVKSRDHRSTLSLAQPRDLSLPRTRDLSQRLGLDQEVPIVKAPLPRSGAPVAKTTPQHLQDRYSASSPFGSKRQNALTPGPGAGEHSRLMADSLVMFETVVSKLPSAAGTSASGAISNAEILKHAQVLVHAADRMAGLMRAGTTRALEEQINVEVEGDDSTAAPQMLEVWRQVGGEYREGLRAADELVRSITSFLVDTGTVMRKLASTPAISDLGSPAVHTRHLSLDEEGVRQQRLTDGDSASGRKSVESRRSWEPARRERELEREETLRKLGGGRESSLGLARASPAIHAVRERERMASLQTPSPASATRPLSSARRLYVPREQAPPFAEEVDYKPLPNPLGPSDSQRTLQGIESAEPSPTPASRTVGRSRTITMTPASRPQLIEEPRRPGTSNGVAAPVDRTASMRDRNADRRKPSVASIATVRGSNHGPPTLTSLTTPSLATTGVSHHTVSSSPEQTRAPQLPRTNSERSTGSFVTFSHPGSASSVALSNLQRQALSEERKRSTERPLGGVSSSPTVFKTPAKLSLPPAIGKARSEDRSGDAKRTIAAARASRLSLNEFGEMGSSDSLVGNKSSTAHAADRAATVLAATGGRSRRRTVTDIWPSDSS